MINVLLVQVVDSYGPNKFLPLAIAYQWLTAQADPHVRERCRVLDVLIEKLPIPSYLDQLSCPPDVVAMSCYVWNWEYNQRLAQAIRQRWPQCQIIVGGPQISKHDPNLVRSQGWFDVAVLGENESVLGEFLLDLDAERITHLPGVITRYTQEISQPPRTQDLDSIPSPILSGFYDAIMERYRERGHTDIMWQVTWETMRGCPYHCSFCDIGDEYWNKTKWFDLQRIQAEIDWMASHQIEYVSVCDSNWGIHPRDIDITQWVIDAKLRTGFPRILDVTWAKNNPDRVREIVMRDQRAGSDLFRGVNFSMQSLDPDTLVRSRRFNLTDSVTRDSMRFFHDHAVPTFTELIWPMPGETLESFTQGLQKLIDIGQRDFLSVHPLVLTPNAPMGQPDYQAQHGIESSRVPLDTFWLRLDDPDDYVVEQVDAVRATATASYEDMLAGNMIAHWLVVLYYYGWAHYVMRYVRQTTGVTELEFVKTWISWISQRQDWVAQEHHDTHDSLVGVFDRGQLWGRRVPGGGEVLWEYKSATSVRLHRDRDLWWEVLGEFLETHHPVPRSVIDINRAMCVDWRQRYPIQISADADVMVRTLGIHAESVEVDHSDIANINDEDLFIHKAYHWRRKVCYWRCRAQPRP